VEEGVKIEDIANKNSRIEYEVTGEGNMRQLNIGDIIQIERRGYYFVDQVSFGQNSNILRLHFIPDGSMSGMSKLNAELDAAEQAKGKGAKSGANKAEQKKQEGG